MMDSKCTKKIKSEKKNLDVFCKALCEKEKKAVTLFTTLVRIIKLNCFKLGKVCLKELCLLLL